MKMTVGEIACLLGGTVAGDASVPITGVNGIRESRPGDITFARSPKYYPLLQQSAASAVLIDRHAEGIPMPAVIVKNPDIAFLQLLNLSAQPPEHPVAGVHPMAAVSPSATLGQDVAVAPFACIEDRAQLGDRVVVYPGAYIGPDCVVGADTVLYPNAVVRERCQIGARCIIHAGACIGSDGFGFAPLAGRWIKIPQTGIVCIGDDVEVGSNTAVDRATFGQTVIGQGTKIDNLVQIGHNVVLGEHCAVAGKAGIAGSAVLGNHVRVGADAGIAGHIEVGDHASIGARAGVTRSVEAGKVVSGFPAIDHDRQRRVLVAQQRVPEVLRRIARLEQRLTELEERLKNETKNHC